MPPRRKAAATKAKAGGKKLKKGEEDDLSTSMKEAFEALKQADAGNKKKTKVDQHCPYADTASIVEDYDCMLNQTNIGHNNNKYYVIQVLQQGAMFYAWNRWGRVGEPGQNAIKGPMDKDGAVKDFKKKFKDKTKNNWDDRDNFTPVPGKYTMIEMDDGGDEEDEEEMAKATAKLDELDGVKRKVAACTLDKPTQDLVKLIFDNDMFKEAMQTFHIDVKKMPLGKLSKTQIAKGFEALEEIQAVVEDKKAAKNLQELTSRFYTLIPHDFGRQRPPIINTLENVREKMDMLMVLADIELAQAMQKEDTTKKKKVESEEEIPHPLDVNYERLNCELELVDKKSKEFKILQTYTNNTGGQNLKIQDIWRVDRIGETDRFNAHKNINERKLLWHGTNVAVVAAILKSGLRIMPHSGGRVGRGIYFASENSKSAGYVSTAGRTGIMFLNEVALGKEHTVTNDDWRLTKAPSGYDCIVARGRTEPNPKDDVEIDSVVKGKKVVVPQGKVINTKFSSSSFYQSEYLVYKESQNNMRYLLKLTF